MRKIDWGNLCPYTEGDMAVRIKEKAPLTIPDAVRRRAGIKPGDEVEFKPFRGGVTVLTKRLSTQAAERLTPEDATKLRHAMKQARQGKATPWSQVKHELGL
jgi:bifunctional DNA-binding transcriptional regulator/antitoxin component of YhaV-PrlF toxin-antitoxin module